MARGRRPHGLRCRGAGVGSPSEAAPPWAGGEACGRGEAGGAEGERLSALSCLSDLIRFGWRSGEGLHAARGGVWLEGQSQALLLLCAAEK